jgi:hypothetical protein
MSAYERNKMHGAPLEIVLKKKNPNFGTRVDDNMLKKN